MRYHILISLLPVILCYHLDCTADNPTMIYNHTEQICYAYGFFAVLMPNSLLTSVKLITNSQSENLTLTSITGLSFYEFDFEILYVPTGIEMFIPNLRILEIRDCQLMKVEQEDLENLTKLVHLWLPKNKIEILEIDLMKFNHYLMTIDLSENFIKIIDEKIFDHLKDLKVLNFEQNGCIWSSAKNIVEVKKLIDRIKKVCLRPEFFEEEF